jgi:DNA-binding CsgD family transcriptional regulator
MRARLLTVVLVVLVLSGGLALLDQSLEGEAFSPEDFAVDFLERALLFAAVAAVAWVVADLRELRGAQAALQGEIDRAVALGEVWAADNPEALDDLGAAIERQFEAWSLTPAEADIAGLILKGASLREIAVLRRTSEATIRQQAQSVYRKSGLGGRRELAAYFLEALLERRAEAG